MQTDLKNNLFYGFLALLASFCWGLSSVFIKIALESMSPMYIMSFRFSLAALCFILVFHKRILKNLKNIKWIPCILIGLFLSLMNITVHYSLNLTGATTATFFFSIPAVFTPFIGCLLFRYRLQISHLLIVAFVVIGLYMLCNTESGFRFGWGEFLGAVSSLTFAIAMVLQNQYLPQMDDITVAALQTIIIAVVGWIFVLPTEGLLDVTSVLPQAWLIVCFLGVFGAFLTAIFQNVSINHINADFVSVILAAEPVFTAVIAYFVLKETLTPIAICGAVIIMVCIIVNTLFGNRNEVVSKQSKES
jgi:drug/metabolite transporter (DMT)-like permease